MIKTLYINNLDAELLLLGDPIVVAKLPEYTTVIEVHAGPPGTCSVTIEIPDDGEDAKLVQ